MSAIFWSSYVGFPIFPLLWTIYYFVSLPNVVFFFHGLLTFYITFWFAFPSLQISILLGFSSFLLILCCTIIAFVLTTYPFVIYFHGCFVDMISCFYFQKASMHGVPIRFYPPIYRRFPSASFSPSFSTSFICNFIMIITPSNIYYHHF